MVKDQCAVAWAEGWFVFSCDPEPAIETFRKVKAAAHRHLRADANPVEVARQPRRAVPGLTESWFC